MSITPGERKALFFLAALLSLGAGARMLSAARHQQPVAAAAGATALAAQIAAVDSARALKHGTARPRRKTPRTASLRVHAQQTARADSTLIVDVDRASAAELEQLPRVGPALARRIISNRDEFGPYGSLQALSRVKGIGPKMVTRLAAHVTFSGSARPSSALSVSPGSAPNSGRYPPPG